MRNEQQRLQLERYCSIFRHTRRGNTALHPPKTKQATDSASKRSCSGSWDVGKTASKHVLTPPTQTCKSIATSTSAGPPEPASSPPSTSLSSPESWVTSAGSGMLVSHSFTYFHTNLTSFLPSGRLGPPSKAQGRSPRRALNVGGQRRGSVHILMRRGRQRQTQSKLSEGVTQQNHF